MDINDSSPFMQVNAVAQRVRQLIRGAQPRIGTHSRRPTAIALAEFRANALKVYDPNEAAAIFGDAGDEETDAVEGAVLTTEDILRDTGGR